MSSTYRRSIILINKRFQLRFAVYICLWIAAICFVYPLITKNLFEYFISYAASDPMGPELGILKKTKDEILQLILLTEAAFLTLTFLLCLYMSHRIAGPLYKLGKSMRELGGGTWRGTLGFRHKDWFTELAEDFNVMNQSLQNRSRKETDALTAAIRQIETGNRQELERALASLKSLRDARVALDASGQPQ